MTNIDPDAAFSSKPLQCPTANENIDNGPTTPTTVTNMTYNKPLLRRRRRSPARRRIIAYSSSRMKQTSFEDHKQHVQQIHWRSDSMLMGGEARVSVRA